MGNVGSGFGNPNARCGSEDGYFPVHAPLGFPNCANYKGTQAQRIADLRRLGYGTDIINAWIKYYAENPSDPLKIDYTKVGLKNINNSMSKDEAVKERELIGSLKGNPRNYGTWSQRLEQDRKYNANYVKNNIAIRLEKINAVLSNPNNIQRWEKEELKKQEDERLIQIKLENEKLEKERLEQEELIWKQLEFLKNNSNELESFYDLDKTVKEIDDDIQTIDSNEGIETIEGIEGMNGIDSMSNQIPLEKITPVMLLLGAGIVFYLFGSGRFDKK